MFTTVKKKVLIAAHMGTHGSNIPGNTQAAFELALRQGADIIELDVTKSADGALFVFHPETEKIRLGKDIDIRTMPAVEVEKLHFVNVDKKQTSHTVTRLEDMLTFLKGRCVINIDKFFDNPLEIGKLVREMKMQDQVIVKTPPTQNFFDKVAEVAGDLPYMPFVYDEDICCEYLNGRKDLRYSGSEVVYYQDDSMLASPAYIEKMHSMGKQIWINSIRYSRLFLPISKGMSALRREDHHGCRTSSGKRRTVLCGSQLQGQEREALHEMDSHRFSSKGKQEASRSYAYRNTS